MNNAHHFFTGAQRHARFIALQKEMHSNRQCMELERTCDLLDVILEAMAEYAESSGQTKINAATTTDTNKEIHVSSCFFCLRTVILQLKVYRDH